ARLARVAQPEVIGLLLELPRVLELRRLGSGDAGGAEHRVDGRDEEPEERRRRPHLALLLLAQEVMAAHVADLVREHAGKLVVVLHPGEQAREHEHVAAGDGEGVERRVLHDVEAVVEALRAEDADQLLPDPLDVPGHHGILDDRQLGARREQETPAELALVDGARRCPHRDQGREAEPERPCREPALHAWPSLRAAASSALAGSIWYERRSPKAGVDSAASRNGP